MTDRWSARDAPNNSTPRCQEASAKLAWERALAFFKKHLA
jgi:hypothetical protein